MIAISTATKKGYIALSNGDKEDFYSLDADCKQSENMMKELDRILTKNKLSLRDIGDIAVVIGPGSFTGIRIGVALVKGLCAGDPSHSVIPISTFDFMAQCVIKQGEKQNFTCVINALGGKLFVCEYDSLGNKLSEEKVIESQQISGRVYGLKEENLGFLDVELDPTVLIDLAERGKRISASQLSPVYIRRSEELFKSTVSVN